VANKPSDGDRKEGWKDEGRKKGRMEGLKKRRKEG